MIMPSVLTLTLVVTFLLAGCATNAYTTTYSFENQTYTSRDEASAAANRRIAETEAAISVGNPIPLVERKLLVVVPTAMAVMKTLEAKSEKDGHKMSGPGTPIRANLEFIVETGANTYKSVGNSLKKANIYRDVEILVLDTTAPNIQPTPTQDVVSFYWTADSAAFSWYFLSAKSGKQIIATDQAAPSLGKRRRSMVDDVKAKALQ